MPNRQQSSWAARRFIRSANFSGLALYVLHWFCTSCKCLLLQGRLVSPLKEYRPTTGVNAITIYPTIKPADKVRPAVMSKLILMKIMNVEVPQWPQFDSQCGGTWSSKPLWLQRAMMLMLGEKATEIWWMWTKKNTFLNFNFIHVFYLDLLV